MVFQDVRIKSFASACVVAGDSNLWSVCVCDFMPLHFCLTVQWCILRLGLSAVSEPQLTSMSADTICRPELDSEHNGELADLVAAMNVAGNRLTPPNGYRSGPPRTTGSHRARLSDRKLSLQERGSRMARQPTIETKRVSITDADVRRPFWLNSTCF